MIRRRSKLRRGLIILGTALPSIATSARAMWRTEGGKRWLVPLVVFLSVTGLVLIVAASVEALAPFIYAIF
jgi:hypothetical protein